LNYIYATENKYEDKKIFKTTTFKLRK